MADYSAGISQSGPAATAQLATAEPVSELAAGHSIEDLCRQLAPVCASAVDPLEIASALEFDGVGDAAAATTYGYADVFALAEEMWRRTRRRPAEPDEAPEPWLDVSGLRPALRTVLYALPAVFFLAGAGLFTGTGVYVTLVVALLTSWSLSQGLAFLGYRRLGTVAVYRTLLTCLLACLAAVTAAVVAAAGVAHAQLTVLGFGLGEGMYMLSASVLMVLGAERRLLLALTPGVLASGAFLAAGRPLHEQPYLWAAMAATPALALSLAFACVGPGWRAASAGPRAAKRYAWHERGGALTAAAFGLVAGGLMVFPVAAGPDGHGGVSTGALLGAMSLTLSVGAGEWFLLWYRRRTRELLRTATDVAGFARRAREAFADAVLQYMAAAAAVLSLAAIVADRTGLLHLRWQALPAMTAYLALGTAMFVALLLQALGDRTVPLAVCAAALAAEIGCRDAGWADQVAVPAGLTVVLATYAATSLGNPARHA
jgi:hypothetical protein